MTPTRTLWHSPTLDVRGPKLAEGTDAGHDPERYDWTDDKRVQVDDAESANLVASLTSTGLHAPVLDLDYAARLVPSSTPGHHHLFLDVEIPWYRYVLVLWALKEAGLIESGYFRAAVRRGATFARTRPTKPVHVDVPVQRR